MALQRGGVSLRRWLVLGVRVASACAARCGLPAKACSRLVKVLGRGRVVYGLAFSLVPFRRPPRSGRWGESCRPVLWRQESRFLMSLRADWRVFGDLGASVSRRRRGVVSPPEEEVWCRCFGRWSPLCVVAAGRGSGRCGKRERGGGGGGGCECGCVFCLEGRAAAGPRAVRRCLDDAIGRAYVEDRVLTPVDDPPPMFVVARAEDESEAVYAAAHVTAAWDFLARGTGCGSVAAGVVITL